MTELGEVFASDVDERTVLDLIADVSALGSDVRATVKRAAGSHAEPPSTLGAACAALLDGTARAVQIRYAHADTTWCDTIARTPDGYRIVRTRLPSGA